MTSIQLLKEQTKYLTSILSEAGFEDCGPEKLSILEKQDESIAFLDLDHPISNIYPNLNDLEKISILSIAVIGQADNVFHVPKHLSDTQTRFKSLLEDLTLFETFYQGIGGIVGYHLEMLKLICAKKEGINLTESKRIHQAQGISLHEDHEKSDIAVIQGLLALPKMGEIYPIGGAGDRLNLTDEKTGLPLPTAKLNYLGQSLLTCMIKDLQAREYVYFKLFNKQLVTPIAMMTSEAKNNHHFVNQICEANHWYHRKKDSFKLFKQPLAPVLTVDGDWSLSDHLKLFLKPSGHGVIWKLASDLKVFDWFKEHQRPKALVRQMNNPMASTDQGIFALIGIGCSEDKAFGFASCQRIVHAAEGANVLTEVKDEQGYHYAVTNIEYTEFDKYQIKDVPNSPNSPYSIFPANTNILFVDFKEIKKALEKCSIPGMLINMKSDVPLMLPNGDQVMKKGGRLESTMQNIADYMVDTFDEPKEVESELNLRTFLTYNVRRKTISVAKKTYQQDGQINETPEGCYYSLMQNQYELFSKHCQLELPALSSKEDFIAKGPNFHSLLHPSLGPLYSIIAQKIHKGKIATGSEMVLYLSELEVENLSLSGSLLINTDQSMGHLNSDETLVYSNRSGKCSLINVEVDNRGIDRTKSNVYWKNHIHRHEIFQIHLEENAEFYAKDVTFKGDYQIHVPKNTKMIAKMDGQGKVTFEQFHIEQPTWYWTYEIDSQNHVQLKKNTSGQ